MLASDHAASPAPTRGRTTGRRLFLSGPDEGASLDRASVNYDDHGIIWSGLKYAAQHFADIAEDQGLSPKLLVKPEIYTSPFARSSIGVGEESVHVTFRTPLRARVLPGARNFMYFPWGFDLAPRGEGKASLPLADCARAFALHDGLLCDTEASADRLRRDTTRPVSVVRPLAPAPRRAGRRRWAQLPCLKLSERARRASADREAGEVPLGVELRPADRAPPTVFVVNVNVRDWDPSFRNAVVGFMSFARSAAVDARLVILADANGTDVLHRAVNALFGQLMLPEGIASDRILLVPYAGTRDTRLEVGGIADFAVSYSGAAHADLAFLDLVSGGALPIAVEGATLADYLPRPATTVVPAPAGTYAGSDLMSLFPLHVGSSLASRHLASYVGFREAFAAAADLEPDARHNRRAAIEDGGWRNGGPNLRQALSVA